MVYNFPFSEIFNVQGLNFKFSVRKFFLQPNPLYVYLYLHVRVSTSSERISMYIYLLVDLEWKPY